MAIPTTAEWHTMGEMAGVLVKSQMVPKGTTQERAIAVILKGHELGLQPMQSFALIHVINDKPPASSEFMLGLLARGGVTWNWIEKGDNGKAIIEFRRDGFEPVRGTFTIEEAQQAKLPGKGVWTDYPANMLRARAVANGARMIGPDLLMGMSHTPEEMGADVDENEAPEGQIDPSGPSQAPPENAKTQFKNACEGVIVKINDEDQVAIVLTTCGYDHLAEVQEKDFRRVYDALKEKKPELEEKRAATKLAAN